MSRDLRNITGNCNDGSPASRLAEQYQSGIRVL